MNTVQGRVSESGRLSIPAEFRRAVGLEHGGDVVIELVGHFARIGSPEADIRMMLDPLPFVRVALDEELAFIAGLMLPATRQAGLSFGDRACLALANKLGVQPLTADRTWQRIGRAVGVEIELIRGDLH